MEIKKVVFLSFLLLLLVACGGGGGSSSATPTPIPTDATPEQVMFNAVTDAEIETLIESNQVQVVGINVLTPIEIVSELGEYSINNGAYTNIAGQVSNNDLVQVRLNSGGSFNFNTVLSLNIGDTTAEFSVTTGIDPTAPTTTIEFPPNNALTSSETITIRGNAVGQGLDVVSVAINGEAASSDDGFATWQIEMPLEVGSQALAVVVVDETGNSTPSTLSITREAVDTTTAFPSEGTTARAPSNIVFDENRNRLLVSDNELEMIVSIDLASGEQAVLLDATTMEFSEPISIRIMPNGDELLVLNRGPSEPLLYKVDLVSLEQTIIYESDGNANVEVLGPADMIFHPDDADQVLVVNRTQIYQLSLVGNGGEELTTSGQPLDQVNMLSLVYDSTQGRVLILSGSTNGLNGLFSLMLSNNNITPFSTNLTHPNDPPIGRMFQLSIDPENGTAHFSDTLNRILTGVSLNSGAREILFDGSDLGAFQFVAKALKVENFQYLFFIHAIFTVNETITSIRALDLETGEDVIISRWIGGPS